MAARKHAILSASSAHRWMNCNPSARLEQEFEDRETEAAAEGTAAHALCEHKLRRAMKMQSRKPTSQYDCDEMDAYTDDYVQFVLDTLTEARANCADPMLMIEQRLDFSCYVPDGFGTGDCVIIADRTLHIIDFKYGQFKAYDENGELLGSTAFRPSAATGATNTEQLMKCYTQYIFYWHGDSPESAPDSTMRIYKIKMQDGNIFEGGGGAAGQSLGLFPQKQVLCPFSGGYGAFVHRT